MFGIKENQRLYLSAWNYNACRMLGELAEIVKNNGGKVKPFRHVMANNREYEPDAEPIQIYGQSWITFQLDGILYGFSIEDNPFFDHRGMKRKIKDGKVLQNVYADLFIPGEKWIYDCMFRVATDAEVREIANILFNELVKAPLSEIYHDGKRVKVPNTFDGGWHWKYTREPDTWEEVSF